MAKVKDERLAWLLGCASQLHVGQQTPVSMRSILRELGISLEKRIVRDAKHGGGAVVQEDQRYKIILKRPRSDPQAISPRERFTLAHELGHIFLLKRFGWAPQIGSDYFICEDWCDLFAAHLLVPAPIVETANMSSPEAALKAVRRTALTFGVSSEVAARRITEVISGVAYCCGSQTKNSKGKSVFRVQWATSSIVGFELHRGTYLFFDHPLGSKLLSGFTRFQLSDIGNGCARLSRKRSTAAIVGSR